MSLAEFALPSTQSRNRNAKKDEFNEIRSLIIRIQRERRKNESFQGKNTDYDYLDEKFAGDECGDHLIPTEDLQHLFRIASLGLDDSSSKSSTHKGKEKDTKTKKRDRPWTTNALCSTSTRSSSLLWSSYDGSHGLELFHIRPEIESIIEGDETLSSSINSLKHNEIKNCKDKSKTSLKHNLAAKIKMSTTSLLGNNLDRRIEASRRLLEKPGSSTAIILMKKTTAIRPQLCPSVDVSKTLKNRQNNMQLSFEIRNKRIEDARVQRSKSRDNQLKRLEETLQRKEQHRLDHLTFKTKETRQTLIISTVKLVSTIHQWFHNAPELIANFRNMKIINDAARKIQHKWKKEAFLRRAMEARIIRTKLKGISFRLNIWSRCARRRLNAKIIREFFVDVSSNPLPYLIFKFRARVIRAQKMVKTFVECKYARILSLELSWGKLEKEMIAVGKVVINTAKRGKKTISDITHKKIFTRGNEFQLGDGISGTLISEAQDQKPHSLNTFLKELLPNRDPRLCRDLCRFHLEDSRRSHIQRSGVKFVRNKCSINRHHAIQMLKGIETDNPCSNPFVRRWPLFSLFLNEKDQLISIIKGKYTCPAFLQMKSQLPKPDSCEDFLRDEVAAKKKVIQRRELESLVHRANHFASSVQHALPSSKEILSDFDDKTINENLLTEMRVIFQLIDVNGNKTINDADIRKIRCLLGFENHPKIQTFQDELDFKDFVNLLKNCSKRTKRPQHIVLGAFQYFSRGSVDTMSVTSLNTILRSIDNEWSIENTVMMINNIGLNKREFNYKHFISTMYNNWACNDTSKQFNM